MRESQITQLDELVDVWTGRPEANIGAGPTCEVQGAVFYRWISLSPHTALHRHSPFTKEENQHSEKLNSLPIITLP